MRATVIDRRIRRREGERLPSWTRRLYQGGLLLALVLETVNLALAVFFFLVPSLPSVVIDPLARPPEISDVQTRMAQVQPGEILVALNGVRFDASGPTAGEVLRSLGRTSRVPAVVRLGEDEAERDVVLELVPLPWYTTLEYALGSCTGILVALLGLLALRARAEDPAIRSFLAMCLLVALPLAVVNGLECFLFLTTPWDYLSTPILIAALIFLPWPFLFGIAGLRFLHVFPSRDEETAGDHPVPPFSRNTRVLVWMMVLGGGVFVPLVTEAVSWADSGPGAVVTIFAGILLVLTVPYLLVYAPLRWLLRTAVRIFKLARLRMERAEPEELQRVRLALAGVRLGALLFAVLLPVWLLWAFLTILGLVAIPPGEAVTGVIASAALAAPFVGIAMAISRRGLWDLDLWFRRTTILAVLGALFLVLWIGVEQILEALLSRGVFGAGPVAAGVIVALAQRPLSQTLTRRFFPGAADFPRALGGVSHRLAIGGVGSVSDRIGTALLEGLEARPVVVVRWREGRPCIKYAVPEKGRHAEIVDDVAEIVGRQGEAIVETDDGPLLALRLGVTSPPAGFVLLGLRAGGFFYGSEERVLLSTVLNPLAPLLEAESENLP